MIVENCNVLSSLSSDQIGQLSFRASAKYSASMADFFFSESEIFISIVTCPILMGILNDAESKLFPSFDGKSPVHPGKLVEYSEKKHHKCRSGERFAAIP